MADAYNLAQAGTLSPEDFAQQQQLNRQQQMANMLMQQSGQPQGQMISGRYVAPSWAQQLVPLANIMASKYIGEKADTQAAQLAAAIRGNRNAAEQKILDKVLGTPDVATEVAGPYTGNVPMPVAVKEGSKPDLAGALREINSPTNYYGAGQDLKGMVLKQLMPEPTPEEKRFKAAVADGSWNVQKQGGLNAFLNQMSEKDKASLAIDRARLGIAQQQLAYDTGMGIGGTSGGGVAPQPYATVAPGSPILAPGQQPQIIPQTNMTEQMPRFQSKAQQDVWVATQKEKGKLQAEAQNALPGALQTVQSGLDAINGMIGDTTVDAKGNLIYGKVKPHAGFEGAVGVSGIGSGFGAAGFIPGTDVKDFQSRFKQVEGQAFLGAINTLRGTGQITEIEGAKATAALNRMNLAQSEAEFVRAANEFKDVLQKGYKAAQQKAGVAPINYGAQPTASGSTAKYRYNPATGTLE